MKDVAIVMSFYNNEKHIDIAIQSILDQSFTEYDLYIYDDGSTDNGYEICKQYKDKRIKLFKGNANKTLPVALNILLKKVFKDNPKVKYIARQDADDLSEPGRLKKQIKYLEKNKDCGMVGTWYVVIDEHGKTMYVQKEKYKDIEIKKDLFFNNWFCHGSILFKAEVFKKVGFYCEQFRYCQDYELYHRIIKKYKVANIPEFLYKWRFTGNPTKTVEERKYYVMTARYKQYCESIGIDFNINNARKEYF